MLRRDYILRMIEDYCQILARINALKNGERWDEAADAIEGEFRNLLGSDVRAVARLSETELLARIVKGAPTQAVRERTLILTTLLKEAGDVATAQDNIEEGRACYLKGLNLMLDTLGGDDPFESPEFVPKVELFVGLLDDAPLPLPTQARLMQYYEQAGEFGKAEDFLYAILDDDPANPAFLDFGMTFYRRIANHDDDALIRGNLPRAELESGLADLQARKASLAGKNRP